MNTKGSGTSAFKITVGSSSADIRQTGVWDVVDK